MKQSRRNRRNAVIRAEKRADGPPRVSKYARKIGRGEPEAPPAKPEPGGVVATD